MDISVYLHLNYCDEIISLNLKDLKDFGVFLDVLNTFLDHFMEGRIKSPFVCLSVCLSVSPSICLSVFLSVCLSFNSALFSEMGH